MGESTQLMKVVLKPVLNPKCSPLFTSVHIRRYYIFVQVLGSEILVFSAVFRNSRHTRTIVLSLHVKFTLEI